MRFVKSLVLGRRWTLLGFFFGLLFVAVGTFAEMIRIDRYALNSLLSIHAANPLLWIIDTAPFVLAGAGYLLRSRIDEGLVRMDWRLGVIVSVLTLVPVSILGYAVHENRLADQRLEEINLSGSLRYRSLLVQILAAQDAAWESQYEQMRKILDLLRVRHPAAVERVEPYWHRYSESLLRSGEVDAATTSRLLEAADVLTNTIEVHARTHGRFVMAVFIVGILGLVLSALASLYFLLQLRSAQLALRESEIRFRVLANAPFEGIVFSDEGVVLDANQRFVEMLGYNDVREVVGRSAHDLTLTEDIPVVLEKISTHDQAVYQARLRRKDGTPFWAEIEGKYLQFGERQVRITAIRDITDRREAEQALVESHAWLVETQRSGRIGTWDLDLGAGKGRWSEEMFRLFGFAPGPTGPPYAAFLERIHPDDRSVIEQATQHAVEAGEDADYDVRIQLPEGIVRSVYVTVHPVADAQGRIQRLLGTALDVTERKDAERTLKDLSARLRTLIDSLEEGVLLEDEQRVILIANAGLCEIFRLSVPPSTLSGMDGRAAMRRVAQLAVDSTAFLELAEASVDGRASVRGAEVRLRDGRILEMSYTPVYVGEQRHGHVWHCRDVTESRRAAERLRESEQRFRTALQNAPIGMALVSTEGRFIGVNQALCDIVGYSERELLAVDFQAITHHDDLYADLQYVSDLLAGRAESYRMEKRYLRKGGGIVWVQLDVSLIRDQASDPVHFIAQIQNITHRKETEQQLLHLAFHDALTGLPNRRVFTDHLERAIARRAEKTTCGFAVLFVDLDRFKEVNDTFGHHIGDKLLVEVAERLKACLREGDIVARLAGDEFAVLLHDTDEPAAVEQIAERIQQSLQFPVGIGGQEILVGASIGVVIGRDTHEQPGEVLHEADFAMYEAKAGGRGRYVIRTVSGMPGLSSDNELLAGDLGRAIDQKQLVAYYQPIVRLDTGALSGFEALVRWRHPTRGLVPPADFVPLAESAGLIVPLGAWMLEEAVRQQRIWQREMNSGLTMNVNVSPRQLADPEAFVRLQALLERGEIDPLHLTIEVTEGLDATDIAVLQDGVARLHELGVRVGLDDFGTGYASMEVLLGLRFDLLKIDRAFVQAIGQHRGAEEIMRALMQLADELHLDVIAEGIETPGHLAWLRMLGCTLGQGFLFARPVPAVEATDLIARQPWQAYWSRGGD